MSASAIYTITAFSPAGISARVFGWFPTYKGAAEAVRGDSGSMHEEVYTTLVIEEVNAGVHGSGKTVQWFEWTNDQWEMSVLPDWSIGMARFSMG